MSEFNIFPREQQS